MLQNTDFLHVVKNTPLVSIDLLVRCHDNSLLMGLRKNDPASGYWFVPGGRVRKDEELEDAFLRITNSELNIPVRLDQARFVGVFTHKYNNNYTGKFDFGTHYIAIAYELTIGIDIEKINNDQHSEYRWISKSEHPANVHQYSTDYLSILTRLSDNQYLILNNRRDNFNNLIWQTPGLSLVAQAFLFTIILSDSSSVLASFIASFLSVSVSVASRHLLDKHRYAETECAKILQDDEKLKGIFQINRHVNFGNKWVNFSSYRVWSYLLPLFGIAAIISFIVKVLDHLIS